MKIRRRLSPFIALLGAGSLSACELFSPPAQSPEAAPTEVTVTPSASAEPVPVPSASPSVTEPPPAPPPDAPGIESQGGPTRGRLPKAAINEGVQRGMPDIEACYLQGAKRKPGLRGRILVNFVIAPDGTVPYAASLEQGTDFPDNAVIDCVLHAFQKLHFAEPVGGRVVATYPLTLEPAPDAAPSL